MTLTSNKFFLYLRKSTDDPGRQIRSIEDQLAELLQLADREHLTIVETFTERQTAKVPGRPVFNMMLDRIERGEANAILAWHPDRLARNSVDGGRLIYLIDNGKIADLRFPTFTFEPTSSGKFMLSIMFGYSKYYVDSLSENIKRGQRQRIKNGYWPKPAPIGYLNNPLTRIIEPDPIRAPLVRKAFELYASGGYTLARLRETVNTLGLTKSAKPLSVSYYQHLLNNPIYYGVIRYNGELYPAKHEALITKKLFDAAQEIMACRSKPKLPTAKHCMYRGMFQCGECGAGITSEVQKGHEYLRCTKKRGPCTQRYTRIEAVTRQIHDQLLRFALPDNVAESMLGLLEGERIDHDRIRDETSTGIRDKLAGVDERLKRLMDAYLKQVDSLEEYRHEKNRLIGDRRDLEDQLLAVTKNRTSWLEPAIRFIQAAKSTVFWANARTDDEKRDFLKKVGSNLQILDRMIKLVPRGAWKTVVDSHGFRVIGSAAAVTRAPVAAMRDQPAPMSCPLIEVRTFFKDNPEWN